MGRRESNLREDNLKLDSNPLRAFEVWFQEAIAASLSDATAMTLATSNKQGRPSARTVLFKGLSDDGFSFFTNYESRKSVELLENPFAALVFYWPKLQRQVRIEGQVEKLSIEESTKYFNSRERGSRLGAWSSPQSKPVADRAELLAKVAVVEARFANVEEIPLPPFWGGFRVVPNRIEFWEERPHRVHERIVFARANPSGPWTTEHLAP